MKITKLGHCCLLIEHKEKRILTDPGAWTTVQNELMNIDLVLITHEHADHFHIDSLQSIVKNNPHAKVITNRAVGKLLAEKGIAYEIVEEGESTSFESILLEGFGNKHEEIYKELGQVQNTGYFIDNKLFYPGDAFTNPGKAVEILAFPIVAPWTTFKTAIEYVLGIAPHTAFPVHDGMLVPDRAGMLYRLPSQLLEEKGIVFIPLRDGESFERE